MYTKHGHHILGTPIEEPAPTLVARCGGPSLCLPCSREMKAVIDDILDAVKKANETEEETEKV